MFGGAGGGKDTKDTTDNIFMVMLKDYRGHVALEWVAKPVAEPLLQRVESTPALEPEKAASSPSAAEKGSKGFGERFTKGLTNVGTMMDRGIDELRGANKGKERQYSINPLIGLHCIPVDSLVDPIQISLAFTGPP